MKLLEVVIGIRRCAGLYWQSVFLGEIFFVGERVSLEMGPLLDADVKSVCVYSNDTSNVG